jgi:D-glycero-D-manno-heptose 1,7-bisphosphate phosphatase
MSHKALFLDRDGTIIVDVHHGHDPDGVVLIPGAREALLRARDLGYQCFLFTNQSGIGRGYFTLEDAIACNQRMIQLLELGENLFTEICIAPEHPDDPPIYRKPNPRFILESISRYQLDPAHTYMIGDRSSDWLAGINAGAVSSGKPLTDEALACLSQHNIPLYPDLLGFIQTLR